MTDLYLEKDKNVRRTWIIMVMFTIVVIIIAWIFTIIFDAPEITISALLFALFMNVFSYWFSDRIVISLANAKEIDTNNTKGLQIYRLVENLAISSGLPMPKVYVMEDEAMNAFATGRNPEKGVIVLTTGLIDRLEKVEIDGVIAHELSHIGNRDTLVQTISVVLVGLVALLSDLFLRMTFWGGGNRDRNSNSSSAIPLVLIGLLLAILAPIFTQLLHLAVSRKREYLADATGALMTRYPEALASALRKISQDSRVLKKANRATAHMYIYNPFSYRNKSELFSTHPPVAKRIEALTGMKPPE